MIVVKVELWSAVTGATTELARMEIANDGKHTVEHRNFGDYDCRTLRGRSTEYFNKRTTMRETRLLHWPRTAKHVWNMVQLALTQMGYGK